MEKRILLVSYMDTGFMPLLALAMNDHCSRRRPGRTNYRFETASLFSDAAGMKANEDVRRVVARRGFSLDDHRSRFVGSIDIKPFHRIICVTEAEVRLLCETVHPLCEVSLIVAEEGTVLRTRADTDSEVELMVRDVFEYAGRLLAYL